MQAKLERVQAVLQSLGLSKTLNTLSNEVSNLDMNQQRQVQMRHQVIPSNISLSGIAVQDSDSSNPFGGADYHAPNFLSKGTANVFSDDNHENPFNQQKTEEDDLSSIERPRGLFRVKSDIDKLDRIPQSYSSQLHGIDHSDSSFASPNLSENSNKPAPYSLKHKRTVPDPNKINRSKLKNPFENPQQTATKYSANDLDITPNNLSFTIENKNNSIDELHHSDDEHPVNQFSFCENVQPEGEAIKPSNQLLAPSAQPNQINQVPQYTIGEPEVKKFQIENFDSNFPKNDMNRFPQNEPIIGSYTSRGKVSQKGIRTSNSPTILPNALGNSKMMIEPQPNRLGNSGVVIPQDSYSARSSKSVNYHKPIFEDNYNQIYAISEMELRSLSDFLKQNSPYLFKMKEPSELAQWDASRVTKSEAPSSAIKRKPEFSLKVFLSKEEKKDYLRDRYKINHEIKQVQSGTIYSCFNTKNEITYAVKKVKDDKKSYEQGLNEIMMLNQLVDNGDPDRYNFITLCESFYYNVR